VRNEDGLLYVGLLLVVVSYFVAITWAAMLPPTTSVRSELQRIYRQWRNR
jgi:hypothetical protein